MVIGAVGGGFGGRSIAVVVSILSLALSGCSSTEPVPYTQTCNELQSGLDAAGVQWPIANVAVTEAQAGDIHSLFAKVTESASDDFKTVLKSWTEEFAIAAPYLVEGDQDSYINEVPTVDQEIFLYANSQVLKFCNWG
jgi:hypothetical protein